MDDLLDQSHSRSQNLPKDTEISNKRFQNNISSDIDSINKAKIELLNELLQYKSLKEHIDLDKREMLLLHKELFGSNILPDRSRIVQIISKLNLMQDRKLLFKKRHERAINLVKSLILPC